MSALRITDLVYRWPRQATACIGIPHFDVALGERVFLHGASGSGKSTLLGLLGGVAVPQSGRIELLGLDIAQLPNRARDQFRADHIGFVFQQFNLLPWLSALDNVLLPCTFSVRRKQRAEPDPRAAAERLLAHLDLAPELWPQAAAELSVGQQQRVAAARALIGQPEFLIADEPTSALDAERQQIFIDLLLREAATVGATLIFVSHDRPANQIVHAVSAKPLTRLRSMDAVWVSGTLSLQRADTPWGKAGYRLAVDKLAPYEEPKKQ